MKAQFINFEDWIKGIKYIKPGSIISAWLFCPNLAEYNLPYFYEGTCIFYKIAKHNENIFYLN
jgi:hypothetical protein